MNECILQFHDSPRVPEKFEVNQGVVGFHGEEEAHLGGRNRRLAHTVTSEPRARSSAKQEYRSVTALASSIFPPSWHLGIAHLRFS